ncbi:hypothetical protein CISIN_1g027379mg [Citrus sinensis]|uniref:VQ domain-containing protein n=1 Tax=Citrus sinensis TaxID=2711 RepID=A0A067FH36_CITSI|nr:hypothetical protein CISIN_1g027379mg [Citrus sinensis]
MGWSKCNSKSITVTTITPHHSHRFQSPDLLKPILTQRLLCKLTPTASNKLFNCSLAPLRRLPNKPLHQQQQIHPTPTPTNNNNKSFVIPPIKTTTPKKQNFKLYERRANNFKNSLMINTLANNCAFSPRNGNNKPEILSPSLLDFPKLALSSPVTPLNEDPFNKSSPYSLGGNSSSSSSSEEERAIAEKGFYLHPSPMSTPRDHEPQLLTLFPLTSPRVSGSSS